MAKSPRDEFRLKAVRTTPEGMHHPFEYRTSYGWAKAVAVFIQGQPTSFRRAGTMAPGFILATAQRMASITRSIVRDSPKAPGTRTRIEQTRWALMEARNLRLAGNGCHLP